MFIILSLILTVICIALRITISGIECYAKVANKDKNKDTKESLERKILAGIKVASLASLRAIRFVLSKIRTLLLCVGFSSISVFLISLSLIFIGSAGFLAEFATTNDSGNLVMNKEIISKLSKDYDNSSSTTDVVETNTGSVSITSDADAQKYIRDICLEITDYCKKHKFEWSHTPINPAINHDDHFVSCDRFVGWVLWNLGMQEGHPQEGLTCNNLDDWCANMGFKKITERSKLEPDCIMFQGQGPNNIAHVYLITAWDESQQMWERFDCGSTPRISNPGKNPSVEPVNNQWLFAYKIDYTKINTNCKKSDFYLNDDPLIMDRSWKGTTDGTNTEGTNGGGVWNSYWKSQKIHKKGN